MSMSISPGQAIRSPLGDALLEWANLRNRPVVSLIGPQVPLTKDTPRLLRRHLADKDYAEVDVVVYSGGGDIHAAYQILEVIRLHAKVVHAVVPVYAKSAATLLCLGANTIALDELGELGPLDTQMGRMEDGVVQWQSGLGAFKTLEQLREFSLGTMDLAVKVIMQRYDLNPTEALPLATEFVGTITAPLFDQLDPQHLGESSRALLIAEEYGERILRRSSTLSPEKQREILKRLVYRYPAHDFVVDCPEAQELGLPVVRFRDRERPVIDRMVSAIAMDTNEVSVIEPIVTATPLPLPLNPVNDPNLEEST